MDIIFHFKYYVSLSILHINIDKTNISYNQIEFLGFVMNSNLIQFKKRYVR